MLVYAKPSIHAARNHPAVGYHAALVWAKSMGKHVISTVFSGFSLKWPVFAGISRVFVLQRNVLARLHEAPEHAKRRAEPLFQPKEHLSLWRKRRRDRRVERVDNG